MRNAKHESFCVLLALENISSTEAYIKLGGQGNASRQGPMLKQYPGIKERIAELQQERVNGLVHVDTYDRDYVVRELKENIEAAKTNPHVNQRGIVWMENPNGTVEVDENGEPIPVYKRDFQAINKALELMGLDIGMFPKQVTLKEREPFDGMNLKQIVGEIVWTMKVDHNIDVEAEQVLKLLQAGEVIDVEVLAQDARSLVES